MAKKTIKKLVKKKTAKQKAVSAFQRLRAKALSYPETTEAMPWGECAIKVRGKTFLFMRDDARGLTLSMKLPRSGPFALDRPFAEPTGYGMGKHGWITCSFAPGKAPPMDLLLAWLDESYRAIAPAKLAAGLD